MHDLLHMTAKRAQDYLDSLDKRGITPTPEALARMAELGGPLPDAPTDSAEIIALLDQVGSPATVASTGGRYYGFVIGGALPGIRMRRRLSSHLSARHWRRSPRAGYSICWHCQRSPVSAL